MLYSYKWFVTIFEENKYFLNISPLLKYPLLYLWNNCYIDDIYNNILAE